MEKKSSWKRFRRLRFDTKSLSKRAQRAETLTTRHAHKFVVARLASIRDVSRQVTIWLFTIAILIGAVAVQLIWFQEGYKTVAVQKDGTYAEATLGPINTLNPLYAQSSAEMSASQLIFSRLFDYDARGHLRDDLANSMSVDKTGKVYTVTLRPGVKWHDDVNLTADDVVYTVNAMKDPNVRAVMRSSWTDIVARALDPLTVQFTLPSAYAAFPQALTFSVLPKHILASVEPGALRESTFSLSPVGSGPFSLRLLQTASRANNHKIAYLSSWDNYYRGVPKLAHFELHAYDSPRAIVRALQTREVTAAVDINDAIASLPPGIVSQAYPTGSGVYALFNTSSPILRDASVRKALQVGTDTSSVRNSLAIKSPVLDLPFIAHQVESTTLPHKPALNLNESRTILDKDGWKLPAGSAVRMKGRQQLKIKLVSIKDAQYDKVVANLADQWRKLGFAVDVSTFNPKENSQNFAQAVLQPRAYDVLINELALGADPDVFAYWHSSQANANGFNFSNYNNAVADDALSSARLRSEPTLRDQKYKTFATQWLRDAPAVGLYQSVLEYAHSAKVHSISDSPILPAPVDRYDNVLYWTAGNTQVYKTP